MVDPVCNRSVPEHQQDRSVLRLPRIVLCKTETLLISMARKANNKKKAQAAKEPDRIWINVKGTNPIGPSIRKQRLRQRLTQDQLAAQCQVRGLNLTRGTLAKIEAQIRHLKACELYIIAKVMGVSMEQFYPPEFGALLA